MNAICCARGSLAGGLLIVLSSLLLATGCTPPPNRSQMARPVKTIVVVEGDARHQRIFPGKADAAKRVELAFQVPGEIVSLPVKEGQRVSKGDVIAQLRKDEFQAPLKALQGQLDKARANLKSVQAGERPEQIRRLESQVRAAEARLSNARTEYNRYARMVLNRSISRQDFEQRETNLEVARQELQAARDALEKGTSGREEDVDAKQAAVRGLEARVVEANLRLQDTTLRAPYDGVIAKRMLDENKKVQAKEPVVRFQDVDEIEIAVDVPETLMAAELRSADIITLLAKFSAAPGLEFPVHIREIAQKADPITQTFRVRVAMKAPQEVTILPGMSATVTVTYRRASILGSRILVPINAVTRDDTGAQVAWVLESNEDEQTVTRRPVKVGEATGDQIEILDGLKDGDRIAVAGVTFLREGMKVRDLGDALGGG
jgi:multidrug efflux system membrane fusion protein